MADYPKIEVTMPQELKINIKHAAKRRGSCMVEFMRQAAREKLQREGYLPEEGGAK